MRNLQNYRLDFWVSCHSCVSLCCHGGLPRADGYYLIGVTLRKVASTNITSRWLWYAWNDTTYAKNTNWTCDENCVCGDSIAWPDDCWSSALVREQTEMANPILAACRAFVIVIRRQRVVTSVRRNGFTFDVLDCLLSPGQAVLEEAHTKLKDAEVKMGEEKDHFEAALREERERKMLAEALLAKEQLALQEKRQEAEQWEALKGGKRVFEKLVAGVCGFCKLKADFHWQVRNQILRFGGARFLFLSHVWNKFFWGQQNFGGHCPWIPSVPVATGLHSGTKISPELFHILSHSLWKVAAQADTLQTRNCNRTNQKMCATVPEWKSTLRMACGLKSLQSTWYRTHIFEYIHLCFFADYTQQLSELRAQVDEAKATLESERQASIADQDAVNRQVGVPSSFHFILLNGSWKNCLCVSGAKRWVERSFGAAIAQW